MAELVKRVEEDVAEQQSPPAGRREAARKATIDRILSAAAKVFARAGYEGATMTDIAIEARLPKPNVNYYFREKRVLYRRVLQMVQALWSEPLDLFSTERHPAEVLEAYIRAKIELARRYPLESRVFASEMIHDAPLIGTYLRGAYNRRLENVWKTFDVWIAANLIDPIDPKHLMLFLWAASQTYADHAVQVAALFGRKDIPEWEFETAAAQLSALVINGNRRRSRSINTSIQALQEIGAMRATAFTSDLETRLSAILSQLIAIPSIASPGDTRRICQFLCARLEAAGWPVQTVSRREGIDNLVAMMGRGSPCLAFNAHVDTVAPGDRAAWVTDPFVASCAKGWVSGLGAANCKGSAAVHLLLAEEVARRGGPQRGTLVFTFVGDEETLGSDGTAYLRERGLLRPDVLIFGAPTENQIVIAERGVLWAQLTTRGQSAHAGNPDSGDNAILRMLRVLSGLEPDMARRLAGRSADGMRSTINIGVIRGGDTANVVPNLCQVEIDRRLLVSETVNEAIAEIDQIVSGSGEPPGTVELRLLRGTNGFSAPSDGVAVSTLSAAIQAQIGEPARLLQAIGASDGRYFAGDGIEIVNFGPGEGAMGHAANERVSIGQLADAAMIQMDVINRLVM